MPRHAWRDQPRLRPAGLLERVSARADERQRRLVVVMLGRLDDPVRDELIEAAPRAAARCIAERFPLKKSLAAAAADDQNLMMV